MAGKWLTQAQIDRARHLNTVIGHSLRATAEIMHVSRESLTRAKARGWKVRQNALPPPPADFYEVARRMGTNDMKRHYRRAYETIIGWLDVAGLPRPVRKIPKYTPPVRPCPPDFAEVLAAKGFNATRDHYRTCTTTMKKWKAELGIPTPRADALARKRRKAAKPANDIIAPPPGYEDFKRKLPRPRDMFGMAA